MLFWFVVAAVAIYFLVYKQQDGAKQPSRVKSAETIVRERYARGEIDEAQFVEMKRVLSE